MPRIAPRDATNESLERVRRCRSATEIETGSRIDEDQAACLFDAFQNEQRSRAHGDRDHREPERRHHVVHTMGTFSFAMIEALNYARNDS